ncbi:MAG: NAD(P)/FAD-dependent oxidoreductase [Pseudomonadota bacterium]
MSAALLELQRQVQTDLTTIAHPRMRWLTAKTAPDGSDVLDVLVVGAGQSGIATAFGLKRARVDNILVVDRAARGLEGPWNTYARMDTLRSPKDFTGPDLDLPSLTYEAWHTAKYGRENWQQLGLIARQDWADYLLWVRDTIDIPVCNGTDVQRIDHRDGFLVVEMSDADGLSVERYARRVVLATGQDGMGCWWLPPDIAALPEELRAHTADEINFGALKGRRVAIIGAGASAFDNAACALEHGAKEVALFCRRDRPQVIQPYRWLTFRGFLNHLGDLDDVWRWRFMQRIMSLREGFPQQTYDRCARHNNFRIVAGAPCTANATTNSRVALSTPRGTFEVDFVIAGTGIEMDFAARPELSVFAHNIATWGDCYLPPPEERNERLARYPYLSSDFTLAEKVTDQTPWIDKIHVFSIASTMSFGPSGSSINAMTTCVPKLVSSITKKLFQDDIHTHWDSLTAYDVPQAIIDEAVLK